MTLALIIPAHHAGENFARCLVSVSRLETAPDEFIVVVDGGDASTQKMAEDAGARVLVTESPQGPAFARNRGAEMAKSEVLFFVDSDVEIASDATLRIMRIFESAPELCAVIGSYDDAPGASNFLSQYKNLLHHFTHQTADESASTFWGACGAIRREAFLESGGFDESFARPCIEDIELGTRLKRDGKELRLDREIQVKHLKEYDALSLLRSDFFDRALPWTELIWSNRHLSNDLNLKAGSRLSTLLCFLLVVSASFCRRSGIARVLAVVCIGVLLWLNAPVYRFFYRRRGAKFCAAAIPWHWLYYIYSGLGFGVGTLLHFARKKRS